jgi:cysteine desulfurase
MRKQNDHVYLDYAASTPVRQEALDAMEPYWQRHFGNPQSSHQQGQKAKEGLHNARKSVAETLGVQASEIIFLSGATEANNIAIQGRLRQRKNSTALVSAASHPSMWSDDTYDLNLSKLDLNTDSRIDTTDLKTKAADNVAVVSVPYVNSATGVIEPLQDIRNVLDNIGNQNHFVFHTDASQAGCFLPLQPEHLGVDMMTINSDKLYGPKGVGLLWVRSSTALSSVFLSGANHAVGDYQILRPGTPPVPLIVGFAKALSIAQEVARLTG